MNNKIFHRTANTHFPKEITVFFYFIVLLGLYASPLFSQTGQWKAYLSYYNPTEIEEAGSNMLYVLASNALYSYNKTDKSLQTYDKTTVLNDCGIAHIAWCQKAKRLVIVYENQNIDLLEQNSNVVNIADYMNKSMTSDKTVYNINTSGNYAYLSTGFGIIKINVADAEISDTYQLGFQVNYSYIEDGYLYAASSKQGLYRGLLTDNLLDKNKWSRIGDYTARPKTMNPDNLALVKTLSPGGPKYNYFGFMKMHQGKLYTCGGTFATIQKGCIQVLDNQEWTFFQDEGISEATSLKYENIYTFDIDPNDSEHLMAGGRNGLYEFNKGKFTTFYNSDNSPIESYKGNEKEYELVTGTLFDNNGNLWLLNSQAPTQSIITYTADRKWVSHPQPLLMKLNDAGISNKSLGDLKNMMTDSKGMMWFVNNNWFLPSFYSYQPEKDILKAYTSFRNDDGAIVNVHYVHCVNEDLEGNIWVGTDAGPLYLAPEEIMSDNPTFTQIKVPRNDGTNFADYLLSLVDISCMAIDQANRKWFGTNGNGVYLISANNIGQIEHFTATNSPLLSNNIEDIAINESTGEVFFGTDKGLCSYMSNATTAGQGMTKDNVYAYPNPVRPDYTGPITITGLTDNADVKIVTANGTLVKEGRASGEKYKWYGIDQSGRPVASGVYMVEVATPEGEKGVVCKIAIVR
ncbi:MAG: Por secretion system protein [Prevotella sp.]|jgi:hypothetical protein